MHVAESRNQGNDGNHGQCGEHDHRFTGGTVAGGGSGRSVTQYSR